MVEAEERVDHRASVPMGEGLGLRVALELQVDQLVVEVAEVHCYPLLQALHSHLRQWNGLQLLIYIRIFSKKFLGNFVSLRFYGIRIISRLLKMEEKDSRDPVLTLEITFLIFVDHFTSFFGHLSRRKLTKNLGNPRFCQLKPPNSINYDYCECESIPRSHRNVLH